MRARAQSRKKDEMSTATTASLRDRREEFEARAAKLAEEIQSSFVDRIDAGETLTPEQSEGFERQIDGGTVTRRTDDVRQYAIFEGDQPMTLIPEESTVSFPRGFTWDWQLSIDVLA
jgi:hypothetical protein